MNLALRSKKSSISTADGFEDFAADINGLTLKTAGDIYLDKGRACPRVRYGSTERTWVTKSWSGLTNFSGEDVWSDGINIYYSSGTTQYVLNKSNSTWSAKTWTGLTNFSGHNIWTDGFSLYYSSGTTQYKLNKNSTWVAKTWSGLTNFNGEDVWELYDGSFIFYYSNGTTQYQLNRETGVWSVKTWSGLTNFYGNNIVGSPQQYFYYNGTQGAYLSNNTWTAATLSVSMYGKNMWTDGKYIYASEGNNHYLPSTGEAVSFSGLTNFYGRYIWTDGINIYYSSGSTQYKYNKTFNELTIFNMPRLR